MPRKVLVTPRSFGKHSEKPEKILWDAGLEVVKNPTSSILSEEEIISLIKDVDGVIVGVDSLSKRVLKHGENLKAISKYGVGTDNIDLNYAKENNIPITITQNANSEAVADYTFGLILSVARKITEIDKLCRKKEWRKVTTTDVNKKTLGLIGLGSIGKKVAKRATGFNMNIFAYDLYKDKEFSEKFNVKYTKDLEELLKKSDFISLHLPLNEFSKHIIGKKELELMKDTACIINTARGGLINEDALYEALVNEEIWGAGIDVFEDEPPIDSPLLALDNVVIGSHSAASTHAAIDNMGVIASENLVNSLREIEV